MQQQVATTQHQKMVFGKLLWLMVTTVIILCWPQWQIGDDNKQFVELLACLCKGQCTPYDFDLLNSHVIKPGMNITFDSELWQHTPVIVYNSVAKDAINVQAASAFVRQTEQELQWYYAENKHQKSIINEPSERSSGSPPIWSNSTVSWLNPSCVKHACGNLSKFWCWRWNCKWESRHPHSYSISYWWQWVPALKISHHKHWQ